MLSLDICSLLEGNITITMPLKKKVQATGAVSSADQKRDCQLDKY